MKRFLFLVIILAIAGSAHGQTTKDSPILVLDAGGHTDSIPTVMFTPDGKQLISVSKDRTARIWDVASGEMLRTLRPPIGQGIGGALHAGAITPNGKYLALAGVGLEPDQCPVYVIYLPTGNIKHVLHGHTKGISGLAFSPDGKYLASCSSDLTARIWVVKDGTLKHLLRDKQGHHEAARGLAFAPDSKHLATIGSDGVTLIWSVATVQLETNIRSGDATVAWSPDGKTVAAGGWRAMHTNKVRLWNPDGTLRYSSGLIDDAVRPVAFTKDSKELLFLTGHNGGGWYMFDINAGKWRVRGDGHKGGLLSGALSPDDKLVATGGALGEELFLWGSADGKLLRRLGGQGRSPFSAAWSKDGRTIAWGNTGTTDFDYLMHPLERTFNLEYLEPAGKPEASKFPRAPKSFGSLSFNTYRRDADFNALFLNDGKRDVSTMRLSGAFPFCFSFLPDGRVIIGATDARVYVFDPKSGKQLRSLKGHTGNVVAVCPSPDGRYILSASLDQTLRIWSPDRDEPLLSLFFAGNEWIAWTPEGYYAASPGGERLMGWQISNGPEKMGKFYSAAQFHNSLYRPDVIKHLLEAGSVAKALALADKQRNKQTAVVNVSEVLPPLVVVTSPHEATTAVTEAQITVGALARSNRKHPVVSMRLMLDGRPYVPKDKKEEKGENDGLRKITSPKIGEVRQSWTIELAPGKHTIAVQAASSVSKAVSEPVEVTFDARGIKRLNVPNKVALNELPCLYVLAVGISKYPGNLKLNYAAKDATELGKTFAASSKGIYQKVEVKLLTDEAATRRDILRGLTWLKEQMTQRDVAIVTFAGHGDKDSDGKFYLLPVDVDVKDLLSSAVPSELFKGALQSIPGKVIVLLDACHSGAVGAGKRSAGNLTDDLRRDLVTDDYGVVVMCSSTGKEVSLESPKVEHGLFTLALVEGLSGKAANPQGMVYLNELDVYVTNRVKELSNGRQHPVTDRPPSIRSFPLSGAAK